MKKHFILTRINQGIYGEAHRLYQLSEPYNDPETWMEARMEFFKKYTIPSIQNQTSKNFVWLLAVDPNTPQKHIDEIESLVTVPHELIDAPAWVWLHVPDNPELFRFKNFAPCPFLAYVRQYVGKNPGTSVITTRLDSDDMIRKNFVETVQEKWKGWKGPCVINFNKGLGLDPKANVVRVIHDRDFTNSFVSFLHTPVDPDQTTTVLSEQHHLIERLGKVVKIDEGPFWIKVCHDHNLVNTMPHGNDIDFDSVRTHFLPPIDKQAFQEGGKHFL